MIVVFKPKSNRLIRYGFIHFWFNHLLAIAVQSLNSVMGVPKHFKKIQLPKNGKHLHHPSRVGGVGQGDPEIDVQVCPK